MMTSLVWVSTDSLSDNIIMIQDTGKDAHVTFILKIPGLHNLNSTTSSTALMPLQILTELPHTISCHSTPFPTTQSRPSLLATGTTTEVHLAQDPQGSCLRIHTPPPLFPLSTHDSSLPYMYPGSLSFSFLLFPSFSFSLYKVARLG